MATAAEFLDDQLTRTFAPQPIVRLEVVRIGAPLAILGFLSTRIAHAADWLSTAGFHPPPMPGDYRQPVSWAPLEPWQAYVVCTVLVIAGLMTIAGAFTRWSSGIFAVTLAYVALADRLATFTVSKLAPIIAIAICASPAGARWSVDAWRKRRRNPKYIAPRFVSGGSVRFFQLMLPIFYFASGYLKAKADWLKTPYVLWTQLHDSYQTWISWEFANHFPTWAWPVMQATTLAFEIGAPLWFGLKWTRPYAFAYGVAMHLLIGVMFGPVAWFAMLMIVLLVAGYAPITWLDPHWDKSRLEPPARKNRK